MNVTYANPFRRLIAYWIDITLLYAVLVGLQFGLTTLTNGAIVNWFTARNNSFLTYAWIFLVISLPMWLYFIVSESSSHQASLGKLVMKLKVTDVGGNRLNVATASLRTIAKLAFFEIGHLSLMFPTPLFDEPEPSFRIGFLILLALMAFYFVLAVITPRHQSLHDLLVKTLVVQREKIQ